MTYAGSFDHWPESLGSRLDAGAGKEDPCLVALS